MAGRERSADTCSEFIEPVLPAVKTLPRSENIEAAN